MEVLAYIPEIPDSAASMAVVPVPPRVSVSQRPEIVASEPVSSPEAQPPAANLQNAERMDETPSISPLPPRSSGGRSRPTRLFSPSVIALAAVAAVFWAAALRNDQRRLEAARMQRPERLAQELPATAGEARSVTP
jgi:hypothetical protein